MAIVNPPSIRISNDNDRTTIEEVTSGIDLARYTRSVDIHMAVGEIASATLEVLGPLPDEIIATLAGVTIVQLCPDCAQRQTEEMKSESN